jgi:hypothetical protein
VRARDFTFTLEYFGHGMRKPSKPGKVPPFLKSRNGFLLGASAANEAKAPRTPEKL